MSNISKELSFEERDNLSIEEMKEILRQAIALKENEDNQFVRDVWSNAMKILSIAGKRELYDLVPELYELLNSWEPYFRQGAVSNLGHWLNIPEFKDKSYEIFMNDKSSKVKFSALLSWGSYYMNTKNPLVLEELYKILINETYDSGIREVALGEIFDVVGVRPNFYDPYTSKLIKCQTPQEFNSKVDWKEVIGLLRKYAPDALKIYPINRK